ncbi:hypothetical protein Tco_0472622 [Tanacetum coccineum]
MLPQPINSNNLNFPTNSRSSFPGSRMGMIQLIINHMMSFLTAVVTSRYPTTNNQLRTSSNPRQQATIYDGKVTVQPVQGRQTTYAAGTTRKYTPDNSILYPEEKGYNMFHDKVLLVKLSKWSSFNRGKIAFLADLGLPDHSNLLTGITHNALIKADDLDA